MSMASLFQKCDVSFYITNYLILIMSSLRLKVLSLYKNLLFMGKDYPLGYEYFRKRCRKAFLMNSQETNPEKIKKMIGHGKYVQKELEALYKLKKYRTLKRRYYQDEQDAVEFQKSVNKILQKD